MEGTIPQAPPCLVSLCELARHTAHQPGCAKQQSLWTHQTVSDRLDGCDISTTAKYVQVLQALMHQFLVSPAHRDAQGVGLPLHPKKGACPTRPDSIRDVYRIEFRAANVSSACRLSPALLTEHPAASIFEACLGGDVSRGPVKHRKSGGLRKVPGGVTTDRTQVQKRRSGVLLP
jgi:hypothetical protein